MRAVVVREYGPVARHRLEAVPDPAPARGEVLIETRAIGVNFPDLMVMQGSYQLLPPRPFSPGKEVAGVVGAVGEGVTRVRAGDHAMALPEFGTYAEKVVVAASTCFRMPDKMPFDEGAVLALAYQTAHFALLERVLEVQNELYALYGEGQLKPEITARYPLERFAEALARFEQRLVQGKIVLVP